MDYQTFRTRKEAKEEIDRMMGWAFQPIKMYIPAQPIKMYIPDDENANRQGCVWIIYCGSGQWLRNDGCVR